MKIKVSAGFTGVIATGSYENTRPSYIAEIELDLPDELTLEQIRERIKEEQQKLQTICYGNFKQDEQTQIVERINKERLDIRFYDGLPSVTSIIGWDSDFFVKPEELTQYASQGSLTHLQVYHYIKTGKWVDVKEIDGSWADLVILKKGSLNLPLDGWDFPAFLKKYPLEKMENGVAIKSLKHKFGGTPDIRLCYYNGKKTMADVKRTPDKIKGFKQISAYIIAEEENGEKPYEQMMLIPLSNKNQQGFGKPIICDDRQKIKQFQGMFLKDRENFKKRFNI